MPASKPHSEAGPEAPEASRRRPRYHLIVAALVIVLAFGLVHGSRVRDNLGVAHWEDMDFIRHNASNVHSLGDCFTERPLWPGLYRPLTTNFYYYMGRVLFANNIKVHHAINVALYIANALLLYLICLRLLPSWWALLPPVLLATRYSHVEVVLNTCEVQTLLSVFFMLAALRLFMTARSEPRTGPGPAYVLSLAAYALALLSKETALVLPALLAAYGMLYDRRRAWPYYLPPAGLALAWVVLYFALFRGVTDHEPTGFAYRYGPGHVLTGYAAYLLTFGNLLTRGLDNLAMVRPVTRIAGTAAAQAALAAGAAATAAYFAMRALRPGPGREIARRARCAPDALAFGFAFFLVALAPYIILGSRLFMRYGYVGHAGLAIAAGGLLYYVVNVARDRLGKEARDAGTAES